MLHLFGMASLYYGSFGEAARHIPVVKAFMPPPPPKPSPKALAAKSATLEEQKRQEIEKQIKEELKEQARTEQANESKKSPDAVRKPEKEADKVADEVWEKLRDKLGRAIDDLAAAQAQRDREDPPPRIETQQAIADAQAELDRKLQAEAAREFEKRRTQDEVRAALEKELRQDFQAMVSQKLPKPLSEELWKNARKEMAKTLESSVEQGTETSASQVQKDVAMAELRAKLVEAVNRSTEKMITEQAVKALESKFVPELAKALESMVEKRPGSALNELGTQMLAAETQAGVAAQRDVVAALRSAQTITAQAQQQVAAAVQFAAKAKVMLGQADHLAAQGKQVQAQALQQSTAAVQSLAQFEQQRAVAQGKSVDFPAIQKALAEETKAGVTAADQALKGAVQSVTGDLKTNSTEQFQEAKQALEQLSAKLVKVSEAVGVVSLKSEPLAQTERVLDRMSSGEFEKQLKGAFQKDFAERGLKAQLGVVAQTFQRSAAQRGLQEPSMLNSFQVQAEESLKKMSSEVQAGKAGVRMMQQKLGNSNPAKAAVPENESERKQSALTAAKSEPVMELNCP